MRAAAEFLYDGIRVTRFELRTTQPEEVVTAMLDPGLNRKVVVVTGANNPNGIGAATSRAFAGLGCRVFLHYLRGPVPADRAADVPGEALYRALGSRSAEDVVEEIWAKGGTAECWEADLAIPANTRELFDRAEKRFGPVEVLVSNAAHASYDTFDPGGRAVYGEASTAEALALTAESHDAHYADNSRAPALLMVEFARRHVTRGARWAASSTSAPMPRRLTPAPRLHGASKHALESYSRAAAAELGRYGITVNVVAPGPIQTGWMSTALEAEAVQRTPLGRIGVSGDVADAVVFLASEQARWITGQTLYVGGGHRMPL
jgi:3-oxoacyl-[acyl-carrier protein] reductase